MLMRRLWPACGLAAAVGLFTAGAASADVFDLGPLAPSGPLAKAVHAPAGAVDDQFTFSIVGQPLNVSALLVNGGSAASGLLSFGPGSFVELFSGTPGGVNAPVPDSMADLVFNSMSGTVTGSTQAFGLASGDYFLEVVATAPPTNADFGISLFASNVPEPSSWVLAILGVAMIGLVARRRREGLTLAA